MLCALTVRKLKPGTLEDFERAFFPAEDAAPPPGWKRFYALRSVRDENEIITFGFFDGTLEQMMDNKDRNDYEERRSAAEQYVESVGTDGVFEVFEDRVVD